MVTPHVTEALRIPVERILLPPNVPAGCNFNLIRFFAYQMRSSHWEPDPALTVRPHGETGLFMVEDGRHRFLGAVIAGRPDVLAHVLP